MINNMHWTAVGSQVTSGKSAWLKEDTFSLFPAAPFVFKVTGRHVDGESWFYDKKIYRNLLQLINQVGDNRSRIGATLGDSLVVLQSLAYRVY